MRKPVTLEQYRERVVRVLDYLWHHLGEDLDAEKLAEIAHFSPFHFQRIYRELMRESLHQSLKRLRLHQAACLLSRSSHPVATIAQEVGYASAQALTRAFTTTYGEPPSRFRQRRLPAGDWTSTTPTQFKDYPMNYNVEISQVTPVSLAGLPHQGDYLDIGQTFEKLFALASSHSLLGPDTRSIGIYYDDPGSEDKSQLRALAGISTTGDDLPTGFTCAAVGGGECAVLTFTGPYSDLEQVYEWLYGSWLPHSGREARNEPPFEEYLNDPRDTPPPQLVTKIYLPLQ
ncbi:AraC family transcriptional regulator [Gilvimarinus algae]|uniref:AraC family transcriptional regulator n=1 Tax=Gilvimarinus algae TaxID=3058037 RepID=A0ABT8TA32_9GAMM|nr:AraC family transcriptional regulator [Gilvimarinus sp. SDUM040014]MDO3380984.1 AraC family transcriptional regulator [Gilvimarinus sp. SDUM040014]